MGPGSAVADAPLAGMTPSFAVAALRRRHTPLPVWPLSKNGKRGARPGLPNSRYVARRSRPAGAFTCGAVGRTEPAGPSPRSGSGAGLIPPSRATVDATDPDTAAFPEYPVRIRVP